MSSDVKHRLGQISVNTTRPFSFRVEATGAACSIGVETTMKVATATFAKEVSVVGGWADRDRLCRTAKGVAKVVCL